VHKDEQEPRQPVFELPFLKPASDIANGLVPVKHNRNWYTGHTKYVYTINTIIE